MHASFLPHKANTVNATSFECLMSSIKCSPVGQFAPANQFFAVLSDAPVQFMEALIAR
ncbi:hypothetical protein PHA8399_03863 [Leisingera aquaemixtae]|uniref:Uncharacterized protein n=1 Tax=Leisingera aquaemixtae TaxID=1396826 RepID=A0A0P1HEB4_9RHOB|nr:hypothetical protein PHA8399_03863 [Leisingera aquaemixtae]